MSSAPVPSFIRPLNITVLEEVYGTEFANVLIYLGIIKILDVNMFMDRYGYDPAIGSIFIYSGQGSYMIYDAHLGNIYIQNGSLADIEIFNHIPYGYAYYERMYGKQMYNDDGIND